METPAGIGYLALTLINHIIKKKDISFFIDLSSVIFLVPGTSVHFSRMESLKRNQWRKHRIKRQKAKR